MFLVSAASGVLFGVIYHALKAIKNTLKMSDLLCSVVDFLYWVVVTFFMAYILVVTNDAILRAYEFCAMILGAILYFFSVGKWIFLCFEFIFKNILKIFDFILKILLTPVRFFDKILVYKFKLSGGANKNAKKEKKAPEAIAEYK